MSLNFAYSFPAVVGMQANKNYFVIMCPLNVLPKLFIFNEEELSPELRSNRTLNKGRLPEMCDYILNNRNDYVFSSLTASIDGAYEFTPFNDGNFNSIGMLKISMDSRLLINDGQHRKSAIEEAIRADASLGNETISVVLFIDEGLNRSQQIFSDLNKHAVTVSKSISITYDNRDPISLLTKEIVFSMPNLHAYTDLENSTLAKFSSKLFTISNIYKTNQRLLFGLDYHDPLKQKELYDFIKSFWEYLIATIPEWNWVFEKKSHAHVLRSDYIISYGTTLEALGIICNQLYKENIPLDVGLAHLNQINWRRNNLSDWKHRIIASGGRILRNTRCINLTTNKIKQLLDLPLTEQELKIENAFMEEHNG